jgi:hypothetical protein
MLPTEWLGNAGPRARRAVTPGSWTASARYKNKKSAAAMMAITVTATSKSRGVRIGRPRRGAHVGLGVGKLRLGRWFMMSSYPAFRRRTPRITEIARRQQAS